MAFTINLSIVVCKSLKYDSSNVTKENIDAKALTRSNTAHEAKNFILSRMYAISNEKVAPAEGPQGDQICCNMSFALICRIY